MSASKDKGGSDARGNPLFQNTGGEKKKIRPPTPQSGETEQPLEENRISTPEREDQTARVPVATTWSVPESFRRPPPARERGEVPFDEFYIKKTVHFIPALLEQFNTLAKKQHKSQTRLLNEAVAGILEQHGALDEATRAMLKELGMLLP